MGILMDYVWECDFGNLIWNVEYYGGDGWNFVYNVDFWWVGVYEILFFG